MDKQGSPNFIDRAIEYIAPRAAAKRLAARHVLAMYGSYVGARVDRREMAGWIPRSGSADADSLLDLRILRGRSRDLQRNAPLAAGAVNTNIESVIGTGLSVQPTPNLAMLGWTEDEAETWAKQVEAEFEMWAASKDCDTTRTQNFYELQALAFRSTLESGDVVAALPFVQRNHPTLPYQLTVQMIEADRLANPLGLIDGQRVDNKGKKSDTGNRVFGGVEVDDNNAPVAYYILRRHPGAFDMVKDPWAFDRLEAFGSQTGRRNVIHLFDRRRPGQTRGIPYLAPVIEMLKQLATYTEAEIQAAVIQSLFTVFVQTTVGDDGGLPLSQSEIASREKNYRLGHGAIIGLAQGQDVKFADPTRPSTTFDPFVQAILRQIGVALEIPFEVLIKHFTASYSAARAALLEAWKYFKQRREWLASNFCQLVYEAFLWEAVSLGRVTAPGFFSDPMLRAAYCSAEWVGDAPGMLNPDQEVTAAVKRVAGHLSSHKDETMALLGKKWEDVERQCAREHKQLVADDLEAKIPAVEPISKAIQPTTDGSDEEKPENQQ